MIRYIGLIIETIVMLPMVVVLSIINFWSWIKRALAAFRVIARMGAVSPAEHGWTEGWHAKRECPNFCV